MFTSVCPWFFAVVFSQERTSTVGYELCNVQKVFTTILKNSKKKQKKTVVIISREGLEADIYNSDFIGNPIRNSFLDMSHHGRVERKLQCKQNLVKSLFIYVLNVHSLLCQLSLIFFFIRIPIIRTRFSFIKPNTPNIINVG